MLPGTTVTVASPTVPTRFTAVSDREGYYRLLELPPGDYELTAEVQGFARFARSGIGVRAGLNLGVDIDMALGNRGGHDYRDSRVAHARVIERGTGDQYCR